ncbi:hypothetical protein ACFYM0_33435 [Streptomyces sp. NPDC006487]|uniref:hypothetical protein n=1 Tax=Streptomyces sp. NPDC006487 TaxID=3364748 RepID=UPI0036B34ECD
MDVKVTTEPYSVPDLWGDSELLEFDIGCNEIRDGMVFIRADTVSFRFMPRPGTGHLECTVALRDHVGVEATATIGPDQTSPVWLCFSGFGWHDMAMRRPISLCRYRVSLDGTDTVRVGISGTEVV